jgi:hypothetical protein
MSPLRKLASSMALPNCRPCQANTLAGNKFGASSILAAPSRLQQSIPLDVA